MHICMHTCNHAKMSHKKSFKIIFRSHHIRSSAKHWSSVLSFACSLVPLPCLLRTLCTAESYLAAPWAQFQLICTPTVCANIILFFVLPGTCMYVCVRLCMYVYVCVWYVRSMFSVCICMYTHTCMYTQTQTDTDTDTVTVTDTHMRVCTRIRAWISMHAHTNTDTDTDTDTDADTHTHI